jgi:hypothetical protein
LPWGDGGYGQRWQAETVFSMIKRRLSAAVAARSYWPQCREVMLLVVNHNVMILLCVVRFSTERMRPVSSSAAPSITRG